VHRHLERGAMVEAHAVVQWRLTECADRERPPETGERV
jgi:hypothetical protein